MDSGTVFSVEWYKPDRPNGVIIHYIVEIYVSNDCDTKSEMIDSVEVSAPSGGRTVVNAMIRNLGNVLYI